MSKNLSKKVIQSVPYISESVFSLSTEEYGRIEDLWGEYIQRSVEEFLKDNGFSSDDSGIKNAVIHMFEMDVFDEDMFSVGMNDLYRFMKLKFERGE